MRMFVVNNWSEECNSSENQIHIQSTCLSVLFGISFLALSYLSSFLWNQGENLTQWWLQWIWKVLRHDSRLWKYTKTKLVLLCVWLASWHYRRMNRKLWCNVLNNEKLTWGRNITADFVLRVVPNKEYLDWWCPEVLVRTGDQCGALCKAGAGDVGNSRFKNYQYVGEKFVLKAGQCNLAQQEAGYYSFQRYLPSAINITPFSEAWCSLIPGRGLSA